MDWRTKTDTEAQLTPVETESRTLWTAAIWTGIGLIDATQTVVVMRAQGMHHNWIALFATQLFSWLPWALATPLVLWLGRRFPWTEWKRISTWAIHLVACAAIGLTYAAWIASIEKLLNPWANDSGPVPFTHIWSSRFYGGLLAYLLLYSFILAVSSALDSRERLAYQRTETARLNEQLTKAQLDALRRQIEPHFLFNALNAIAGLVREERNDAAVTMIAGLSDCLRRAMADSNRQQVPLGEELEFIQKYLDIQKVRFADRLQLSIEVPAELYPAQVPGLILQPMVENAVKHGISKRAHGGAIRIAGFRSNGKLTISVSNDGPSLPAEWEESSAGIGLSNTRTRLRGLYGDSFEFNMKNRESGGVEVAVSVPFVCLPAAPASPATELDFEE